MGVPSLTRVTAGGVTLLGDASRPCGVTLAFTERTGGVSRGPYASLNLGSRCGDDPACVAENRRRALAAIGAEGLLDRLVVPRQVHGDDVLVVSATDAARLDDVRTRAEAGCDAVVCTAPGVPVMLCFADCVPIVLVVPGGFAVVHSGWRGTLARIAGKALGVLCAATGTAASEAAAYVGPHILGEDYAVSGELLARFEAEFGGVVRAGGPNEGNLDLARAVGAALEDAGMPASSVCHAGVSTARATERFYSYRAEAGECGRHAALAVLGG